eukprot:CAMPEP_0178428996 /NCGR_PEP_ID=MMETSP0689_2-20121128/30570_1 /TAXON_ID=160604 /ORGANISM="Amphidinium massartii, Strain CS-259" /LENGTH=543 /DNA_ID=CAMNT_0020050795 /DNA_START=20 /DNA_END=1652 /DNA_ORIENTATION=-
MGAQLEELSSAVAAPADGGYVTLRAERYQFDPNELRWLVPSNETSKLIDVKLLPAATGKSAGLPTLELDGKPMALSLIRTMVRLGPSFILLDIAEQGNVALKGDSKASTEKFFAELSKLKADYERFETFDQQSVQSYFQYYAKMTNQQNMLQDGVRTSTYRQAIVENASDFAGASVMDIGAGSGILSFFAAQAGAAVVYAVEASSMADTVRVLADANKHNLGEARIEVVNRPVEKVRDEITGKVDVLVSEPIGMFLFNERMIESYLCARDRFLKPGGKMFPNIGDLCIAPFSDPVLHWELQNKNLFWKDGNFYGLDLSAAAERCTSEHFKQPVVDYINPEHLVANYVSMRFDFATVSIDSLREISIPFKFDITQPCLVHGLAGWFDAHFEGSDKTVVLSTAPGFPGTHWYQIRFLLETPLAVNPGQQLEGWLDMRANHLQSYYVKIRMEISGTSVCVETPDIDLKDPEYRFFTSQNTYVPPGTAGAFSSTQSAPQGDPSGGAGTWQVGTSAGRGSAPKRPEPSQPPLKPADVGVHGVAALTGE